MARYLNSVWYDEASTNNFWMKWRFHIVKNLILRFNIKANKVLDVGCGQGTFAEQYNDYFKKKITGCDINLNIKKGIKKNKINYINYDISKKNKKYKEFFDLVFILDVIEHVGNDKKFLNDCYFHLKKNGFIIINVPAFQILFSKYDCAVGHKRRYNKKTLLNIIDDKKFKVLDLRYWGLFLMPLLITRKIITNYFFNKSNKKKIIEFGWTTNGLRNIFLQIIALEKFFPLNFFFGSSLTSILIKK